MVCLIEWVKSGPAGTQTCKLHGRTPSTENTSRSWRPDNSPVPALTLQAESLNVAIVSGAISNRMLQAAFFFGTRAPFLRASDRPMAIACLRLFTLPPFPPLPERKVPLFLRRIALATVLLAPLLYRRRLDFFLAGIKFLLGIRAAFAGARLCGKVAATVHAAVAVPAVFTLGSTSLAIEFDHVLLIGQTRVHVHVAGPALK